MVGWQRRGGQRSGRGASVLFEEKNATAFLGLRSVLAPKALKVAEVFDEDVEVDPRRRLRETAGVQLERYEEAGEELLKDGSTGVTSTRAATCSTRIW